jgi:hypothetical protein
MHLECAQSIIKKLNEGGIVVIDDTWTDAHGAFEGKGKLAVPLLLANGLAIIARTPMAVALRRPLQNVAPAQAENAIS